MSAAKPPLSAIVAGFAQSREGETLEQADLDELRQAVVRERGSTPHDAALVDQLIDAGAIVARSLGGIPPELASLVRTRSPTEARESLLTMTERYEAARQRADAVGQSDCRRAVIRGKDRLRRTLARPNVSAAKREEKQELLGWYLSWLENPGLFTDWLAVREKQLETSVPRPT